MQNTKKCFTEFIEFMCFDFEVMCFTFEVMCFTFQVM